MGLTTVMIFAREPKPVIVLTAVDVLSPSCRTVMKTVFPTRTTSVPKRLLLNLVTSTVAAATNVTLTEMGLSTLKTTVRFTMFRLVQTYFRGQCHHNR